ncbi:flagellar basal-body MS-ring/collar protein FliF [Heyndrickxia oleronia]|uniref:Flagellar M-ring protein n=1 Tax=Heyndrickxia oleronia TaxID=38875 RepID=A0A8E2IC08_9BACI|nr:flagellar basal-body MS-ring/collar protein FliF [Heyndrickxia oleronia]MBU5211110.1 flagellar M-ring protein FliF [Heyndrickxia oleronia]MEC1376160.1 flagellar basal-body MS-ring/collar protein FliF [Heyndrickxia oleronia]OOP67171.1 flagellar M-ring protein FliF [Heyndrickxia oleronia]QQZ03223.1 flagellar M-ring protein FliF [Heyndrickxia oleronia]
MNEKLRSYSDKLSNFWKSKSKKQKIVGISSIALIILIIILIGYFSTRTTMEPLYSNLSAAEAGSIKENLDSKGIKSEIADNGKTIKVPKEQVDTLKIELASEGLPKSGSIDYSFFSQNAGFGMTDNEFDVVKLDAMQTELSNLMKEIDGVEDAKVMINMPKKEIFVSDGGQEASASIVLTTKPGYEFSESQIKSLYNLVSKSVPNLPNENIVIMNQNFEYFDLNNQSGTGNTFTQQMDIKHQIERDIQRQVQSMLGTMMGYDKIVASVSADIDFTQENREEDLVEPVDKENMKGIEISAQKITETYSGKGAAAGGTTQAENPNDSINTYVETDGDSDGDYEKTQDSINYEVNKIHKQIAESPYKIRDLGIQVMVEPPNPKDVNSLPQSTKDDITKILSTIIRTSIDKNVGTDLTDQELQNKIAVSVQPFTGKVKQGTKSDSSLPWWIYLIGGILLFVIVLLIILMIRGRKKQEEELMEEPMIESTPIQIADVNEEHETESTLRKKQLEKMAKEKPDEFAKLLRTWISED